MGSNKTGSSAGIHVQARGQDCSGGEVQSIHHATVFQLVFSHDFNYSNNSISILTF
jgi:hypothetical protein